MKRSKGGNPGIMFAMLGAGLILSLVFPDKFLVVVLSVLIIISGIALCKNC